MVFNPKNWPKWFYGPDGQGQIFTHPLDVPDGWHDNPKKVGDPKAVTVIPDYAEAVAAAEAELAQEVAVEPEAEEVEEETVAASDEKVEAAVEEIEADPLPPVDDILKSDIVDRLNAMKIVHNPSWNKDRLYELLRDNLTGAA